ncbi:hypothetical protein DPMN_095841 [Dreissena polymorpha]|uniref:Uncharacterized protein n=1 Tax=Dreissena polymorpha TaxID=45954 RepID=A0A9D4R395_DREPO|nr:hypothetical protein DPMN_095841 [Dreissena polymorpha]
MKADAYTKVQPIRKKVKSAFVCHHFFGLQRYHVAAMWLRDVFLIFYLNGLSAYCQHHKQPRSCIISLAAKNMRVPGSKSEKTMVSTIVTLRAKLGFLTNIQPFIDCRRNLQHSKNGFKQIPRSKTLQYYRKRNQKTVRYLNPREAKGPDRFLKEFASEITPLH